MPRRKTKRGHQPAAEPLSHPVDVHVGQQIRAGRALQGISQEALGNAIGLTFQQVQKYERGFNRVSASKLYDIACALRVPVTYFFEGLPDPLDESSDGNGGAVTHAELSMRQQRAVAAVLGLKDGEVFNSFVGLARAVTKSDRNHTD